MNAVECRYLVFLEEPGGADIRRDHAFLDNQMRFVALVGADVFDLALVVVFKHHLAGIEFDRMALMPRPGQ